MELPEGLKGRTQRIKQVWLLLKSLYGLHQAPLEWNNMFHAFMINQGFRRNEKDYGLYTKIVGGEYGVPKDIVFVTIYVDDLLLIGHERWLNSIEAALMNEFKMTKMGSLRYLLGIEVDLVPGQVLAFRQRRYLDKVIEQFGSQDMHPVEIPMAVS